MSALRPAFFILYLESFISRLNVIPCHDLTLSVSEPDNAAAKQGQELRSEQTAINIHEQRNSLLIFCVLTIRKHLLKMRFERSGRGQEPSRGHKFSILENFLSIRDFTSQTLASFPSDLVGVSLVGATPLHLLSQTALPLKSPTGAFIAALRKRGPTPNPAHGSHLTVRTATACRAYITSPRSYRTDRRYNDQNECSIDP